MNNFQKTLLITLSLSFASASAAPVAPKITTADVAKLDTALLNAASTGNLDAVKKALNDGANINCLNIRQYNFTPLMYAARNGHTDVVQYLLDQKANTSLRNTYGNTAHQVAINHKQPKTAQLLLNK